MFSSCNHMFALISLLLVGHILAAPEMDTVDLGSSVGVGATGMLPPYVVVLNPSMYRSIVTGQDKRGGMGHGMSTLSLVKKLSEFLGGPGKRLPSFMSAPYSFKEGSEFLGGPGRK